MITGPEEGNTLTFGVNYENNPDLFSPNENVYHLYFANAHDGPSELQQNGGESTTTDNQIQSSIPQPQVYRPGVYNDMVVLLQFPDASSFRQLSQRQNERMEYPISPASTTGHTHMSYTSTVTPHEEFIGYNSKLWSFLKTQIGAVGSTVKILPEVQVQDSGLLNDIKSGSQVLARLLRCSERYSLARTKLLIQAAQIMIDANAVKTKIHIKVPREGARTIAETESINLSPRKTSRSLDDDSVRDSLRTPNFGDSPLSQQNMTTSVAGVDSIIMDSSGNSELEENIDISDKDLPDQSRNHFSELDLSSIPYPIGMFFASNSKRQFYSDSIEGGLVEEIEVDVLKVFEREFEIATSGQQAQGNSKRGTGVTQHFRQSKQSDSAPGLGQTTQKQSKQSEAGYSEYGPYWSSRPTLQSDFNNGY